MVTELEQLIMVDLAAEDLTIPLVTLEVILHLKEMTEATVISVEVAELQTLVKTIFLKVEEEMVVRLHPMQILLAVVILNLLVAEVADATSHQVNPEQAGAEEQLLVVP